MYRAKKDYDSASKCYNKVLKIRQKLYEHTPNHSDIVASQAKLTNLKKTHGNPPAKQCDTIANTSKLDRSSYDCMMKKLAEKLQLEAEKTECSNKLEDAEKLYSEIYHIYSNILLTEAQLKSAVNYLANKYSFKNLELKCGDKINRELIKLLGQNIETILTQNTPEELKHDQDLDLKIETNELPEENISTIGNNMEMF